MGQGGGPMSIGAGAWGLYSVVQCIMGNGHMGTPLVNRQTDMTETSSSHNFIGRQ